MSPEVVLSQIEQVIRRGSPPDPPAYTLVLGAGASFGSVPTAKQMLGIPSDGGIHPQAIPLYLHELETGKKTADLDAATQTQIVHDFWRNFRTTNPDLFRPDSQTGQPPLTFSEGLPNQSSVPTAYQMIFAQNRGGGINTADGARSYLRTITLPSDGKIRLNGTHFFLASLLSLQTRHGEKGAGDHPLYVGKRPFARTLFTTNFDPLLQVSLQLFQQLYYMTDRPELLSADALHTDDHPATHLFYAHGSVHRPFLANADLEIAHLRERNAQSLAAYLGRHGVIVLGYSGWDDCLLHALEQTSSFSNNLYWLARGEGSLSPKVQKLLCSRPNAYWVEIADGGQWMNALHHRLCPGMPFTELLTNPIPFLRRRLDQVDLGSIVVDKPSVTPLPTDQPTASPQTDAPSPEAFRRQVVELLKTAEAEFEKHSYGKDPLAKIQSLEHQASLVYGNREWGNAIRLYTEIINTSRISATTQCLAHFRRGNSHGQLGDSAKAIADYSAAIDLPNAPVDQVAKALVNRGITHGQLGDSAKAIADYSAAIDLPNAPVDQVALALVNRGITHGQLGDSAKEIADYSAVITLPNAPADQVAKARSLLSKHRDDEGPPAAQAPKRKR
jgi:hypothetical protein